MELRDRLECERQAILRAARDLIADPDRWTQGDMARDAAGEGCDAEDRRAVRWCAVGAVLAAAQSSGLAEMSRVAAIVSLERAMHGRISEYNDSRPHAEVLAAFDRAACGRGASRG